MINQKSLAIVILLFAVSGGGFALALASEHNRAMDPGFEQQVPGNRGGWTLFETSRFSNAYAHSGIRSMYNFGLSKTVAERPFLEGSVSGSFDDLSLCRIDTSGAQPDCRTSDSG